MIVGVSISRIPDQFLPQESWIGPLLYSGCFVEILSISCLSCEHGWTTVRTLKLGQFSTATVKVRLPARTTKWRTYLQESQAGAGYVASWSPTRRVVR